VAYNGLRFQLKAAVLSRFQLPEGRPISDFPGYMVYFGRNRNQILQDVLLFQLKDATNIEMSVRAPRGRIEVNKEQEKLILHLYDATIEYVSSGVAGVSGEATFELNLGAAEKSAGKPGISDMTFTQLREELRLWEDRMHQAPPKLPLAQLKQLKSQMQRWNDIAEPIRIQMHRQVAFSFACFSFTLIGIPLGIRMHRRETNVGVSIALGLVAIYYALLILASSESTRADLAPHLWLWVPNILFQAVGAVLLWRANRGI
jgi:lipopolysaccharide export system permease protein